MPTDIVIIDYGMANLRSVQKAFEAVGFQAEISANLERIRSATKLVLPGVGAFKDAMAKLRSTGLDHAIVDHIGDGLPFLGICIGLQLLFTRGTEDGVHAGLDIFPGEVVRFPDQPGLKVPHMGWNQLQQLRPDCPLLTDLPAEANFYFVHSYYVKPSDTRIIAASTDYPDPFCAMIWHENVFATQFHPEKSQALGLKLLSNFAKI